MTMFDALVFIKPAVLVFWGLWLALAAFNSRVDPGTNRTLVGNMLTMADLKEGEPLGQGLLLRAIHRPGLAARMLQVIAAVQFAIALGLGVSGVNLVLSHDPVHAVALASWALAAFGALWCFFLIGGLWFGYWIKTPQVQQVHFTLLLATLLTLLVVRLPS